MALIIQNVEVSKAYADLKEFIKGIYDLTLSLRNEAESFSIGANKIDGYIGQLTTTQVKMDALAATPGLAAFAKAQESDPAYDVVAEYNAYNTALDNVVQWVIDNLPKDANGYELTYKRDIAANKIPRQFTTTETASFRTELDAFLATVSVVN